MNTDTALDLIEAAEYLAHLSAKGASNEELMKAAGVANVTYLAGVLHFLRSVGCDLPRGYRKVRTEAHRRAISAALKGRSISAEHRMAVSAAQKARWMRYRAERAMAVAAE